MLITKIRKLFYVDHNIFINLLEMFLTNRQFCCGQYKANQFCYVLFGQRS